VPAADPKALAALSHLPGHDRYVRRCASCHAAPDPGAHASARWFAVMERMQHHMERAGVMTPDSSEQARILEFLRAAARQP
jgi:hypothetical protein